MTTVVVIAGVRFYREGLASLFEGVEGFTVAATAAAITEALPLIRDVKPDIALIATDPGVGPALVDAISACRPETRVVVVGIAADDPDVMPLAEAGVAGYVTNDASADEVLAVVRGVAQGEAPCSPRIAAALLQRVAALARERRDELKTSPLTARELEIVALIDRGLSNKQIAYDLSIEVATVKNHVHNILEKLNVARRGQAAAAIRREI
jgi:two-component system, NarL family, nitrate/nitrite response regulator NarL